MKDEELKNKIRKALEKSFDDQLALALGIHLAPKFNGTFDPFKKEKITNPGLVRLGPIA